MKIKEINDLVNKILEIPNKEFVNFNTYSIGEFQYCINNWTACAYDEDPYYNTSLEIAIYKNKEFIVGKSFKISKEQYNLIIEKLTEVKDYLFDKYNFNYESTNSK